MSHVIETESLAKRYRLGQGAWGYSTLREQLSAPFTRRTRRSDGAPGQGVVWALRDLDIAVDQGEAVGVIGRNGAGKSTLIRVLTGITEPTTGLARTRGRIGALLEVGTGFHPELTGRENVYLNGALLGMSRRETKRRFDDIVDFADVRRFLDTPLKRYSSGMALRLAFAVAAHLEPDILIVDEVLAVGDAEFQRRCLGRIADLEREGRTVVFVSHDLGAVARLCSRAIWLERGRLREDGASSVTIERYLRSTIQSLSADLEATGFARFGARLLDEHGVPTDAPRRDRSFSVELDFDSLRSLDQMDMAIYLVNGQGIRVLSENLSDLESPHPTLPQRGRVLVGLPPLLTPGDYTLGVWIGDDYDDLLYSEVLHFAVLPRPNDRAEALGRERVVQPLVRWHVACDQV